MRHVQRDGKLGTGAKCAETPGTFSQGEVVLFKLYKLPHLSLVVAVLYARYNQLVSRSFRVESKTGLVRLCPHPILLK